MSTISLNIMMELNNVSVNTSSESTYLNLRGLQRGVTYNITVVAVNAAGRSDTGAVFNYTYSARSK